LLACDGGVMAVSSWPSSVLPAAADTCGAVGGIRLLCI